MVEKDLCDNCNHSACKHSTCVCYGWIPNLTNNIFFKENLNRGDINKEYNVVKLQEELEDKIRAELKKNSINRFRLIHKRLHSWLNKAYEIGWNYGVVELNVPIDDTSSCKNILDELKIVDTCTLSNGVFKGSPKQVDCSNVANYMIKHYPECTKYSKIKNFANQDQNNEQSIILYSFDERGKNDKYLKYWDLFINDGKGKYIHYVHVDIVLLEEKGAVQFRVKKIKAERIVGGFIKHIFWDICNIYHSHTHHNLDPKEPEKIILRPFCQKKARSKEDGICCTINRFLTKINVYHRIITGLISDSIDETKNKYDRNNAKKIRSVMLRQASGEFIYAKHLYICYVDEVLKLQQNNYKNTLSLFNNAITSMDTFQRELTIRHSQEESIASSNQNIMLFGVTVLAVVVAGIAIVLNKMEFNLIAWLAGWISNFISMIGLNPHELRSGFMFLLLAGIFIFEVVLYMTLRQLTLEPQSITLLKRMAIFVVIADIVLGFYFLYWNFGWTLGTVVGTAGFFLVGILFLWHIFRTEINLMKC